MLKFMMMSLFVLASCFMVSYAARADEIWGLTAGVQSTLLRYSGSQQRDGVYETGALFSGDYLEDGGLTLGYTKSTVSFKQQQQIKQGALFLSARKHFYPDGILGKVTLRLDGHILNNNDITGDTDGVRAWAMQAGYLPNDKGHYLDLGFARSIYRNNLSVMQFTPTLGLALLDDYSWLQLRGYLIRPSNSARAQGVTSTRALEAKFTYWLTSGSDAMPDNIQIGALFGNRLYTVDMDAGEVANLADLQKGGYFLGGEWSPARDIKLLLLGGQNRYGNKTIGDNYRGNFLYLNLNTSW